MLGVVVSLGARVLPAMARVGGIIENRINPIGIALAGGIGVLVNERNQEAAERRHREQLDQERSHHREMMAQQEEHHRRVEEMLRNGESSVAAEIGGVRRDIRSLNGHVVDISAQFSEARGVLEGIKAGVDKTSRAIGMCTRPQSAPTRAPESASTHAPEPAYH